MLYNSLERSYYVEETVFKASDCSDQHIDQVLMDQIQWKTPNKNKIRNHHCSTKSPVRYKAPVAQNETKHRQTTYQNSAGGFTVLPSHITPPSGLTKFIARNPFESDLTNRLHLSVISPTVFAKVQNSSQDSPGFAWSVEELALIQPARIEEFPVQQLHSTDPEIEVKAQAAINKFFEEKHIIPSPWDINKKENTKKQEMETPTRPLEDVNSTKESRWSQTVLSLPPELPSDVEDILKPYFTFTQEQNVDSDEANSSNNSLRRKLFFNHDDYPEDDKESLLSVSSVNSYRSMVLNYSPPQSGMFAHGTPLKRCPHKMQHNHGTPMAISENASPFNVSPINNPGSEMSCQSIKSRSRSVARLDFTADMSVDTSALEEKEIKELPKNKHSTVNIYSTINTSLSRTEINGLMDEGNKCVDSHLNYKKTKQNETVEMVLLPEESIQMTRSENKENTLPGNQNHDIVNRLKLAAEWCKAHSSESYVFQHSNTFSGISGQQSTFNIAQDTGYQTCSMSNTTSITENCNVTPSKHCIRCEDKIVLAEEEMQLSDWKMNMKYVFSSTPSKHAREKDN